MEYRGKLGGVYEDSCKYQNDNDDLLIFGYSCKLFRDDEKATSLENGEHLIPWMGESSLMIDRFDVRGALYDLSEAESRGLPIEEILTEAEMKEEEICEQERYLALYHDETQYQMAYEEESKRLQVELASDGSFYNQVGFNYTIPHTNEMVQNESLEPQKQIVAEPISYVPLVDEDVFIPPPEMNIPSEMEVPNTLKQNKIIIKTAKFIVSQGAQMEIIIKTKQAGNPMFNFLAFDNSLNAYYKHVVSLIRSGRYQWEDDSDAHSSKGEASSDQYLHPNLSQSVRPDLTPGVASSPARPSPHCAYSKLITKIREKQKATSSIEDVEISSPAAPSSPIPCVPSSDTKLVPPANNHQPTSEPFVGLVDYPSFNLTADGNSDGEEIEPDIVKKPIKIGVHDYRSIKWPPREEQMVIDKMASYIIKNGNAFEEVVRNRDDPRFDFLNKSHEYHPYYKCKIQLYTEVYGDIFKNTPKSQKKGQSVASKKPVEHVARNGGSRTISFSIKSREQEVPLTSHTTFPIESSTSEEDEDMEEDEKERRKIERAQRRQARKQREEKEKKEREEYLKKERLRKEKEEEERKREKAMEDESSGNEDLYDIFKYAQEMERDTHKSTFTETRDEANSKQEQRKKNAAVFLSKLKDSKDEKKPVIYGPQIPPEIAAEMMRSMMPQSPTSSSKSSSDGEKPPLPPPPSIDICQPPPPPPPLPRSPSPLLLSEILFKNGEKDRLKFSMDEILLSPKRKKGSVEDSTSMASVLLSGLNEIPCKQSGDLALENLEAQNRKSRSQKKHSRQKSDSWSPSSSRRDRKKRKRSRGSSHRRKKRRSRSPSRTRSYSKSHRSSHKKKQSKHSSQRDKAKTRKKKHKRHRSPSSVSSLPSSESSSRSSPTTLPSESESDMDVQVIESDEGKSSRGSSIVSLPATSCVSRPTDLKKRSRLEVICETEDKGPLKVDGSPSGGEDNSRSSSSAQAFLSQKHTRSIFPPLENSNSSECPPLEVEKKTPFNHSTSSAMAKIAQGLRAKLNALLEQESKME